MMHGNGNGRKQQQSWNSDSGMALGVEALGRARRMYGRDGEGVREYGRLVLQLLERESEGSKEVIRMCFPFLFFFLSILGVEGY